MRPPELQRSAGRPSESVCQGGWSIPTLLARRPIQTLAVIRVQVVVALLLASWCLTAPGAAPVPPELSWSAPAECPSRDDVAAALARLAAAGSKVDAAKVEIVPLSGRWQATLSTRGAQRRLQGESCAAVVQALTVVLALAAEQAEQETSSPAAAPTAAVQPAPAAALAPASSPITDLPEPPTAPEPASALPAPEAPGWRLRMGMLAEMGLLPGPALGPQAALGLSQGAWRLELGATLLLPRHAELGRSPGPSSEIDWLGGQLGLCRSWGRHLGTCLGAELGQLSGTGAGVDEPAAARGWWLAASAGARLQGLLARRAALSLQLGLELAAALARPEFGFDELGVLHRPAPVSGRLFLGVGWGR